MTDKEQDYEDWLAEEQDRLSGETSSEAKPDSEEKKQSYEEWLAEEQARLKEGFTFEPEPASTPSSSHSAEGVLAGLGLGAGVVGGAVAPHPDTVTFEGGKADVIVAALKKEISGEDTGVKVDRTGDSVVLTFLQSQESRPRYFYPVLSATLIEKPDMLTVTVSDLGQDAKRGALGSVGRTVVDQGKRLLFRRRGIGGLFETAGDLIDGVEDIVEDIQDLGLRRRVWDVIDRVGAAAEDAYLDRQRRLQELQREREAAVRAWTNCESCGRAYREDEIDRVDCPSCGAPRGPKPDWLD
jgi:predicted Zn-ribbon and HTH transcriptional regulator